MNFEIAPLEKLHRASRPEPDFNLGYSMPFWQPDSETKSAPEVAQTATTAASDEPPTITPLPRDLAAEVAELIGPVTDYLNGFEVSNRPDDFERGYVNPLDTSKPAPPEQSPEAVAFEARKNDLLVALRSWSASLTQFLSEHRTWAISKLRAEYGAAWQAARTQINVVSLLVEQIDAAKAELRHLEAQRSQARLALNAHAAAKPVLSRLPSAADLAAWENEHTRLKTAWESADRAADGGLETLRRLLREHDRERRKEAELRKVEADVRTRLSGLKMTVTGLVQPAEL